MDIHPTPFPDPKSTSKITVKSQHMKPKSTKKPTEAPTTKKKKVGPPLLSERRVFGTSRNPNIPLKTVPPLKPAKDKPTSGSLKKTEDPPVSGAEEKNQISKKKKKKKSVCFQESNEAGNFVELRTPAKSPAVVSRSRLPVTPYHSADICSKCRFDMLETSSYWIGQIKLGEAVGKHFVSAAFFRLAFDCEAEPMRNIRVELKKYLARHEYLNGEEEWKKLSISYGLTVKEDNGREVKAVEEEENASNQEDNKDLVIREIAEAIEKLEIV